MYLLEWRTVSALTRGSFLCLFPELRSNEGNKYKNNTRVSAETVRHESAYIISFLTRHSASINHNKTTIKHRSPCLTRSVFVLMMTSQSFADGVTITRKLWRDHVNSDILLVRYRFYSRRFSRPVVYKNMILHTSLQWLRPNKSKLEHTKYTPWGIFCENHFF